MSTLGRMILGDDDWMNRAACHGVDQTIFFPESRRDPLHMYDEARTYCARCPVVNACLTYGLAIDREVGTFVGFYGNTSPTQRKDWAQQVKIKVRVCEMCGCEFNTCADSLLRSLDPNLRRPNAKLCGRDACALENNRQAAIKTRERIKVSA